MLFLIVEYSHISSKYLFKLAFFLDLRILSKAFNSRMLLLECCSISFCLVFPAWECTDSDLQGAEGYRVIALVDFGVVMLLVREPERMSCDRRGETPLFSRGETETIFFSNSLLDKIFVNSNIEGLEDWCKVRKMEFSNPTDDNGVSLLASPTEKMYLFLYLGVLIINEC